MLPVRERLHTVNPSLFAPSSQLGAPSYLSSVVPHFLQTRTLRSPRTSCPMRTGPQVGQTSCTFEIAMRLSCSAMPPLMFLCGFGRTCFFTIITCSTSSFASFGNTRRTRPSLPLSRPVITFTVSFRRISTLLCAVVAVAISRFLLDNLRRKRNNLQKPLLAQFTRYLTKHARSDRFAGFVDQNCCILIEPDIRSVAATMLLAGADDDRLHHFALLHLAFGRRFLYGRGDHVAQSGIQSG